MPLQRMTKGRGVAAEIPIANNEFLRGQETSIIRSYVDLVPHCRRLSSLRGLAK